MARTPRPHNTRCLRVWPGMDTDQTPGGGFVAISATSYTLPVYATKQLGGVTFHIDVTAGLTGTFSLQMSLVPDPELTTDADWVTITSPTVQGAALAFAGAAGSFLLAPPASQYLIPEWVRVKFTAGSGAATIRAFVRVDDAT